MDRAFVFLLVIGRKTLRNKALACFGQSQGRTQKVVFFTIFPISKMATEVLFYRFWEDKCRKSSSISARITRKTHEMEKYIHRTFCLTLSCLDTIQKAQERHTCPIVRRMLHRLFLRLLLAATLLYMWHMPSVRSLCNIRRTIGQV